MLAVDIWTLFATEATISDGLWRERAGGIIDPEVHVDECRMSSSGNAKGPVSRWLCLSSSMISGNRKELKWYLEKFESSSWEQILMSPTNGLEKAFDFGCIPNPCCESWRARRLVQIVQDCVCRLNSLWHCSLESSMVLPELGWLINWGLFWWEHPS